MGFGKTNRTRSPVGVGDRRRHDQFITGTYHTHARTQIQFFDKLSRRSTGLGSSSFAVSGVFCTTSR